MHTMDEQSGVPAIVHEQVRAAAVGPGEHLLRAPPVLLQSLPLPGKHGRRVACDRSSSVILRATKNIEGGISTPNVATVHNQIHHIFQKDGEVK